MSHTKHHFEKRPVVNHPMVVAMIIVVGLTLLFYTFSTYQQKLTPQVITESLAPSDINLAFDMTIMSIAQQFMCVCGDCGNLSLDTCTCENATKEREMIRRSLQAGRTHEEVITIVNDTFDGMKTQKQLNYEYEYIFYINTIVSS